MENKSKSFIFICGKQIKHIHFYLWKQIKQIHFYFVQSQKKKQIKYILNSNNWNCEVHSQPLNQKDKKASSG